MDLGGMTTNILQESLQKIATADFSSGALFYLVLFAAATFCCMEGYRFYRMALSIGAFIFGFIASSVITGFLGLHQTMDTFTLLAIEVIAGAACAIFAYKVFLMGVFAVTYVVASQNLPGLVDGIYRPIVSTIGASVAAFLCVKCTRMIIIIVTAVAGGFTMVYAITQFLICVIPSEWVQLPAANSLIWLVAKVFFSIRGIYRQNKYAPRNR